MLMTIVTAFAWLMAVHAQLGALLAALALTIRLVGRFILWLIRQCRASPLDTFDWWMFRIGFIMFGSLSLLSWLLPFSTLLRVVFILAVLFYACGLLAPKKKYNARVSVAGTEELVMEPVSERPMMRAERERKETEEFARRLQLELDVMTGYALAKVIDHNG
jgi:hypothetical protein